MPIGCHSRKGKCIETIKTLMVAMERDSWIEEMGMFECSEIILYDVVKVDTRH